MADYSCWPLWLGGGEVGNVDPDELPLTSVLKSELRTWAAAYDATLDQTYPPDSGFATAADQRAWTNEGRRLAGELRLQLGAAWEIVYFHDDGRA
jgi:hypothetical protein